MKCLVPASNAQEDDREADSGQFSAHYYMVLEAGTT